MEIPHPWLDSPYFDRLLEQSTLDEENKKIVKSFAEQGYLIFDPEIENFDDSVTNIVQDLSAKYKGRIQDAWIFNNAVKAIATAPKILSILKMLYQREPIPFQTLNFLVGTEQKTHSDTIHFHCIPKSFMCGVWVALEDVDANNDPLHYYPGSHKLPIFEMQEIGLKVDKGDYEQYKLYENFVENFLNESGLKQVNLSLKKGIAIIWAANLFHGGSPIIDRSRTRHSQVTHYYFADCLYYTPLLSDPFSGKMYVRDIIDISTGEKVLHSYQGQKMSASNLRDQQNNHIGNIYGFSKKFLKKFLNK